MKYAQNTGGEIYTQRPTKAQQIGDRDRRTGKRGGARGGGGLEK